MMRQTSVRTRRRRRGGTELGAPAPLAEGGEKLLRAAAVELVEAGGLGEEVVQPGGGTELVGRRGGEAHAPLLPAIKGHAVRALPPLVAAAREQLVGEVAVEEDRGGKVAPLEQGQAGRELVDDEDVGFQPVELAVEADGDEEVDLAEDGAEDRQAAEDGGRDEPVAADADVERSCGGPESALEPGRDT